jgi:hypothetical protein
MEHMLFRFTGWICEIPILLIALPVLGLASEVLTAPAERSLAAASFTAERLNVWQKRLNLTDWSITIELAKTVDLKPKTLGNIRWDADLKTAVIRVLDPSEYRMPVPDMLKDMEFTVVHELIHLELASLPRSDASRRDEEFAVNRIAAALLELDRSR